MQKQNEKDQTELVNYCIKRLLLLAASIVAIMIVNIWLAYTISETLVAGMIWGALLIALLATIASKEASSLARMIDSSNANIRDSNEGVETNDSNQLESNKTEQKERKL